MPRHSLPTINPCVAAMLPSATLAVSGRAKALKRAGRPVIELSAGEPDFPTPEPVRRAGVRAIEEGFTLYTANPGMPELREAIASWLASTYGVRYSADQIVCSNGAKQSVAQALLVALCPGDEVLVPAPYWVSYPEMVRLAGARPVIIPTRPEEGYLLTPDRLAAAITEHTRVLILNSPSNPTGAVYTPAQLAALASVLRDHPDVLVVSDEIYSQVLYDAEHVAFASLDEMYYRTVTVNGFSKAYAMTGWRLGYLAGPPWLVKAASKVQGQLTSAPSSISQKAGIAALEMDHEPVREMVRAFRERRDFVLGALAAIPGVRCPRPEGAFYVFPDVSAYYGRRTPAGRQIDGSEDLCFYLLEECDVALVPGDAFGAPYGARISYAAGMHDLREAMRRIAAGITALAR
jgi:aspartate aminotransferase